MPPAMTVAGLVPAAGLSRRMGRPKLILPVGGVPLIARVIAAFRDGGACRVVVVAPPLETPGAPALVEAARGAGADLVIASLPPPDMRASFELGLGHLREGSEPSAVLLAPGDSPGLDAGSVARVILRAAEEPGRIVVPRHDGRRGHPLLLPWTLALEVPRLPTGVGVNALLARHADAVVFSEADDPGILADLDTPEDYRRWSV